MKHLRLASLFVALATIVQFASPTSVFSQVKGQKSEKMRQRLEQLFVWRVSDRLQLSTQEENRFSGEFKKLSDEKMKLSQDLDSLLDQMEAAKDDKKKSSDLLREYGVTLKKYTQSQNKELEVMEHLLGPRKMVQYVLLKREMTQKFKDVLTQSSGSGPVLKEPQVIQEK